MQVQILPSSTPGSAGNSYAASILINGSVVLDAGCVGFHGDAADQDAVRHVFLSHAHLDHTASLPMFLENTFAGSDGCATIHAQEEVHLWLREHMFNDRLWPDFVRLSTPETPLIERSTLVPGKPVSVEGLTITPIPVNHGVPTVGFMVEDEETAIVYSADTATTEELWSRARDNPRLKAVFLECAFPNSMTWLAEASFHLTPALFAEQMRQLPDDITFYPVLLKARYRRETTSDLQALGLPNLRFPAIGSPMKL